MSDRDVHEGTIGAMTILTWLAILFASFLSARLAMSQDFPGAEVTKLVDGKWDEAGTHWAYQGSPGAATIDLGAPHRIGEIEVYPFAGNSTYFYNSEWIVQFEGIAGWVDFSNVVKHQGDGVLTGPGIHITGGDPGVTTRQPAFMFYRFTFDPQTVQRIRYTVLVGDRDGDSNGAELIVRPLWQTGDSIQFAGTAQDDIDGDVSASMTWESALDGPIGAGPSITSSLSAGTHTVTAKASDSLGQEGTATIEVVVEEQP